MPSPTADSSTRLRRPTALPSAAVAVMGVLALSACDVDIDFGDDEVVSTTELESFVATGLTTLDITNVNGDITVRSVPGNDVEIVTITRESREGGGEHTIDIDGDRLIATGDCAASLGRTCSIEFNVSLPEDLGLTVVTRNGQVQVDSVTGSLDVSTTNGSVDAMAVGSDDVEIDSKNGSIEIDFIDAPRSVDLSTSNGPISVTVPIGDTTYDVDASTHRGSIDIDVPTADDAAASISATTRNGAIEVNQR